MYKNIIGFFCFYYPKCTDELSEWESKNGWASHTGAEVQILDETSSALDQNLPGYMISQMPMQILVVTPPAFHLHIAHGHVSL